MGDGKVMYRFIKIDKLTTASATNDPTSYRPYRFGYGVMDKNFNYVQDDDESPRPSPAIGPATPTGLVRRKNGVLRRGCYHCTTPPSARPKT